MNKREIVRYETDVYEEDLEYLIKVCVFDFAVDGFIRKAVHAAVEEDKLQTREAEGK